MESESRIIVLGLSVGQSAHFDPLDILDCDEGDVFGPPHNYRLDRVEGLVVVCGHAPHRDTGC